MTYSILRFFCFNLTVFLLTHISFQLPAQTEAVTDVYETYTEAPREVAFVHLNKSTYIEGEMLGFTAYVFDKTTKATSQVTTNLYCSISDANGTVLKQKLVKVNNGIATNTFDIDSSFTTGIYTFKAYTNWMRNFEEPNHFEQSIKVIDADTSELIKPTRQDHTKIDLQILGEGGHIVYNIPNTVGIIAKNEAGLGIPNARGRIVDESGNVITQFQLNEVGLAKALFNPTESASYSLELDVSDKTIKQAITDINQMGLGMTLAATSETVNILLRTNEKTARTTNNMLQGYQVALHNGDEIIFNTVYLDDEGATVIRFPKHELFTGINIFTVFNEAGQPILERMYFNADELRHNKISNTRLVQNNKDSLDIRIEFDNVDPSKWSNLSASVLPEATRSYNHHSTILSQTFIRPYIKGTLQNAEQYFTSNDRKTAYNLDLLMLTQGWSSYNWTSIFNAEDNVLKYPFEQGINIDLSINGNQSGTYIVYPFKGGNTQMFDIPGGETLFSVANTYPLEGNLLRIQYLGKDKSKPQPPTLYSQFSPNRFPEFNGKMATIAEMYQENDLLNTTVELPDAWESVEQLEEVVLEATKSYTRAESLKDKVVNSRIAIVDKQDRLGNKRLDVFLQTLGFITNYDIFTGVFSITNPRVNWGNPVPAVYLDGALIGAGPNSNLNQLTQIYMNDVDYVEYELYGIGSSMLQSGAGFIKIFTRKTGLYDKEGLNEKTMATYPVPMYFSEEKQYYTPKYQYYNTDFFKEYGTIAWKPKLKVDSSGTVTFKIPDTKTDRISLFIEGVMNDDQFVSQHLIIDRTE